MVEVGGGWWRLVEVGGGWWRLVEDGGRPFRTSTNLHQPPQPPASAASAEQSLGPQPAATYSPTLSGAKYRRM
jgi:hypothetical protein